MTPQTSTNRLVLAVTAIGLLLLSVYLMPPSTGTRAGDVTFSNFDYEPEYPQTGDDITFTVTVTCDDDLEYVQINICNDITCLAPEDMEEIEDGVYQYTVSGDQTDEGGSLEGSEHIKVYFNAKPVDGDAVASEAKYDDYYTLKIALDQEDPGEGEAEAESESEGEQIEDDWTNTQDSDGDLIPDWWETKHGLDPDDGSDGAEEKRQEYQDGYQAWADAQGDDDYDDDTTDDEGDDEEDDDSPGFESILMVLALIAVGLLATLAWGRRR